MLCWVQKKKCSPLEESRRSKDIGRTSLEGLTHIRKAAGGLVLLLVEFGAMVVDSLVEFGSMVVVPVVTSVTLGAGVVVPESPQPLRATAMMANTPKANFFIMAN